MSARFIRLNETDRKPVIITVDGQSVEVLEGDTLMMAVLSYKQTLRSNDFDDKHRSGFCLMGACQDCWVWTENGERIRSCTTYVEQGLKIVTREPEALWKIQEL